jgi:hypothetical protein
MTTRFCLVLLCAMFLIPTITRAQANVGVPVCGTATDGVTDYIPTDWATFTPPAKGGSYVDNSGGVPFGCRITRLTNGTTDFGSTAFGITIYYDSIIPFSSDDKLIMAYTAGGAWYVIMNPYLTGYNGNAVPNSSMPSMNDQAQPIWDRTQPEMFYYTNGTKLMSGTVTGTPGCFATNNCTVATALVYDFANAGYVALNMMDATSESVDGHHIVLVANKTSGGPISVFVFDTTALTSSIPYVTSCSGNVQSGPNNQGNCVHKMLITGDNNVIIGGTDGINETFVWNGSTSICLEGGCGGGSETAHGVGGQDTNGNSIWAGVSGSPVLSSQSSACLSVTSNVFQNLAAIQTNDPTSSSNSCLLASAMTQPGNGIPSWHVGYDGSASQPWVFITWFQESNSFYFGNSGSYVAPTTVNWPLYSGEFDISRVNSNYTALANNNVVRLAQTRNRSWSSAGQYWAQTFGALSYDGLYGVFASNMAYASAGCPSNEHAAGQCSDLYLISAPSVSSFGTAGAPLFAGGSSSSSPPPSKPAAPTGLTATVVQ